jgi:hypothetical protein
VKECTVRVERPPLPPLPPIATWYSLNLASPRVQAFAVCFSVGVTATGEAWLVLGSYSRGPYPSLAALLASWDLSDSDLVPSQEPRAESPR